MDMFLSHDTSAFYCRSGLNPVHYERGGLRSNTRIAFRIVARILPVVVVIVLAATALGCGNEPEAVGVSPSPTTPSSGGGSSASDRSPGTPAPSPVSNTASVAACEPTETVNAGPAGQASNIPTQPAAPTDAVRPPTPTPSPEPVPTATVAVHTQTGGSVIMQAPTSTPTPPPDPTPTPTPVPGPYWKTFNETEYNQFLPPKGAIQWPGIGQCTSFGREYPIGDSTPDGIKSRLQWVPSEFHGGRLFTTMVGPRSAELMEQEQPDLFNPHHIEHFCGFAEALHPEVPVIRTTFEFSVRTGEGWKNDRGTTIYEWDAYRVEIRYIFVDNPEHRSRYLRYQMEQHGPILIEKLQSPCDRTSVRVNPDIYCQTAP